MKASQFEGADGRTRAGKGGKTRTETVSVRLDPKLRYLMDLAARKQRRTLSSFVEWAIEDSLNRVTVAEGLNGSTYLSDVAAQLWDVEEADRFVRLALQYPDLLTHHEQIVWKLIRENGALWFGHFDEYGSWKWECNEGAVHFDRLRSYWNLINSVARGETEKTALPGWTQTKPEPVSQPKPPEPPPGQ